MKWIDYREKLGLGFNDEEKASALLNKYLLLFDSLKLQYGLHIFNSTIHAYFNMVCEYSADMLFSQVQYSFRISKTSLELLSKCVAFLNCAIANLGDESAIKYIKQYVFSTLEDLSISYELITDDDGYFIFPKGAKVLDDALVSEPLEWLKAYPKAHKTYCIALKQYSEGQYIRDTADNLRKALEEFLQEFLGNEKNLETNKAEICKYLGDEGVDAGIAGLFQPLINSYKNINDRIAKHNDRVDKKLLEFLLYQTGVLIRMVLSVHQEDE